MVTLEEFKKSMSQGTINAGSSLQMRNENAQQKKRSNRIPKLAREVGKVSRLLIPKELAFDFDITTGEDGEYSSENKFRPMMSASSLALIAKGYANEVPATKERLMREAGVEEWDTSDTSKLNDEDFAIFNNFAYPQVFTIPIFNTTLEGLSTQAWGRSYIIKVERDDMGAIVGDTPLPLLANRFYNSIANEKIEVYENEIKSGIRKDDKKTQTDKKTEIRRQCSKVSSDYPANYLLPIEVALTDTMSLNTSVIAGADVSKLNEMQCITKYSKELKEAVNNYRSGMWKKRDVHLDFYEVDMRCPTDVDKGAVGQIAMGTRYYKPESEESLKACDCYDKFISVFCERADNAADVEQLVLASTGTTMYNEDVEKKMLMALASSIDLQDEEITQKVVEHNQDFLSLVFGEEGEELVVEVEAGVSDRKEGNLDFEKAQTEGKQFDIAQMLSEDDDVESMDDFEVESISK